MAKFISGTYVICRDEEGKILMVQEGKEHVRETWDFPGGGLEHDETVKECAEREVEEETGHRIEAEGLIGIYIEESDTTDLPVLGFLIEGKLKGSGEVDHDFEGEILDHEFFDLDQIKELDLRKPNRLEMLEDAMNENSVDIDKLRDIRK